MLTLMRFLFPQWEKLNRSFNTERKYPEYSRAKFTGGRVNPRIESGNKDETVAWFGTSLKPKLVCSTEYVQPLPQNGQECFCPSQPNLSILEERRAVAKDPHRQVRTTQDGVSTNGRRRRSQSKDRDPAHC